MSAITGAPLQQARLAQVLTAGWMVVEAVIAISAGLAARSIALTAFGADSLIELFSATIVLRQLLRRHSGEREDVLSRGERQAAQLVGFALYAVIAFIVLSASGSLVFGFRPEASGPGIALAATALIVMTALWRWRVRLADRLGSPALKGDAACSAVCLYMAATTLVGLGLNQLLSWWWADSVAALALIWWIRGEAKEALEAARTGHACESDCG